MKNFHMSYRDKKYPDVLSKLKDNNKIMRKALGVCERCNGKGYYDQIDHTKVNSHTISPPYERVECEECLGTGEVTE